MSDIWKRLILPPLGIILLLLVWQWYCVQFNVAEAVLPKPTQVAGAIIARWDLLLEEGWVTLKATLYGFLLALGIGIPIAVAISNSKILNWMFSPLLIALQSVPKVALAPLVLVWLGTGIESKLAIAWLVAQKNVKKDLPVRDFKLTPKFGDLTFLRTAAFITLDALGLGAVARRIEQAGVAQAVDRLGLDGMLALWQPAGGN